MTKVTTPIKPPLDAKIKWNDKWEPVKVTHCISMSGGTIRNKIELSDGKTVEVDNSRLKF